MISVGVVGYGYWGPNLVRNFNACPETQVVAVCDGDIDRLKRAAEFLPGVQTCTTFEELLAIKGLDAVAIATPPKTHTALAKATLEAGLHVLVEKPLATSSADALMLVDLAAKRQLVLMVDHTFIYSGPVKRIQEMIASGELGDLYYIDTVRINLGLFQNDLNVVWDLATHDLSILEFWIGHTPKSVAAFGACHARTSMENMAYLVLDYGHDLLATIHVNWLSPVKIRRSIIGGSRKSIVFDDMQQSEKLLVYDRGITISDDPEVSRGVLIDYRMGDAWSPHIPPTEPLAEVVEHFATCIVDKTQPKTDGAAGLRIVQLLEIAEQSMRAGGQRIELPSA